MARDVEKTSRALQKSFKGKGWQKDVCGKSVRVDGLFYNPFQLRGHSWTTIIGLLRTEEPQFSEVLAQQLSAGLKTKTIFFGYEGTSGIALLLLFQKGEVAEALVNDGSNAEVKILRRSEVLKRQKAGWTGGFYFYSNSRKVNPGMLTQKSFKAFVNEFFRLQDAWLAFDGASSVTDGLATFSLDEGEEKDVLRADLVSLKPARVLTEAQIQAEKMANEAGENSNTSFAYAVVPAGDIGPKWTQKSRQHSMRMHQASLKKLKGLLKRGIQINSYELWQAAKCGNEELALLLIEAGADLNFCPHGSTALEKAVENRHDDIALALIKAGANPDLKSKWSGPPLLLATAQRQTEIVRALLNAGGDVNIRGDVSCGEEETEAEESTYAQHATALIVAVRCGYHELVKMLLKAGADVTLRGKDGKTAGDWAKQLKDEKAAALLEIGGMLKTNLKKER